MTDERAASQLRPGLAVRARTDLRHHRHQMLASDEAGNPGRQMKRAPGADDLGQRGKPVPDLGWIVVDDVVDAAGPAVLEGLDSRCRSVVDVDERPPACAVADQGRSTVTNLREHGVIEHAGAGSVKRSVTQHDAFRMGEPVTVSLRAGSPSTWRAVAPGIGIQRICFGLYRLADAGVGPAAIALGDETLDAGFPRRCEQDIGALVRSSIAACECPIEIPKSVAPARLVIS